MQGILSFSPSWCDPRPSLKTASALLLVILILETAAVLLNQLLSFRSVYLIALLRALDLVILLSLGPWDFSRLHVKTGMKAAVPVAFILGLAGAIFLLLWASYFGSPLFKSPPSIRQSSGFSIVAFLLTSCLLAPFVEELIFRGILYRSARERWPVWFCTATVSLLFAALHFGLGQRFLIPLCGSVIFCLVYEKTKSILTPILVHITGNLLIYLSPLV